AQNFIPQFRWVTAAAERVSKTNNSFYFFFQCHMASDPPAHALADENDGTSSFSVRCCERVSVRCNELRKRIGPPSSLAHVVVIEQRDVAELSQTLFPALHPEM